MFRRNQVKSVAKIKSVLFVCWGNVCRSPAAELILKREASRLGLNNVRIESAGVSADADAYRPSFAMWWASLRRGLWLRPNPRLFRKTDIAKYDLVIAMDNDVLFSIDTITKERSTNVKLMSDFLPDGSPVDVPDPMNFQSSACNLVLDLLERGCNAISAQLSPVTVTSA